MLRHWRTCFSGAAGHLGGAGGPAREEEDCRPPDHHSAIEWNIHVTGFPCSSDGTESARSVGDPGSIPGSGRLPGEGDGNTLQYSCLENSMDRGAEWATVQGVAKSQRLTPSIHYNSKSHRDHLFREMTYSQAAFYSNLPTVLSFSILFQLGFAETQKLLLVVVWYICLPFYLSLLGGKSMKFNTAKP